MNQDDYIYGGLGEPDPIHFVQPIAVKQGRFLRLRRGTVALWRKLHSPFSRSFIFCEFRPVVGFAVPLRPGKPQIAGGCTSSSSLAAVEVLAGSAGARPGGGKGGGNDTPQAEHVFIMFRVCSFCPRGLGVRACLELQAGTITHGVCPECKARVAARAKRLEAVR